jgi:16S rRNA (cytosine967-C5)-methyltransferase
VIAPARRAALDVLLSVDSGRADLPSALAAERLRLRDERDRALLSELSMGTLRWRGELDHLIAAFSTRPLVRLDRSVLNILRLALYQLLHLDRVPTAAVVDDAVNQARRAGKTSAAGFVNAVLRTAGRTRNALPLPPRPATPLTRDGASRSAALDYLSISLSHPRWLAERWLDRWGFEDVEAWLRFNNSEAALTIRTNTLRLSRDELAALLAARGVKTRPSAWSPDGLVTVSGNPLRTDLGESGAFVVQDEASQLVPLLAAAAPGDRILDACAAPGGKTVALAAAAQGQASIVAADVRPRRLALLGRTLAQTGVPQVAIVRADVERPLPFGAVFDVVLLDAPCSGLGTLRRDPDIRWRRREEDLRPLAEAQLRMLRHAAAVVCPGGRLVYATCSSEPEENEDVVAAFLGENDRFRAADAERVRSGLPAACGALITPAGVLRTWPFRHSLEAFFGAVLVRS